MDIRGTMVCISGVQWYGYPGYNGMHIRGTTACISRVQWYGYPGYSGMDIRGTMVCISGVQWHGYPVRGYHYPGYSGMDIRGTADIIVVEVKKTETYFGQCPGGFGWNKRFQPGQVKTFKPDTNCCGGGFPGRSLLYASGALLYVSGAV